MAINGGQCIFPLQNPLGTCAGYSQTWLAFSLLGGGPVTNPGLIHNQSIISDIQVTSGQATLLSLASNGMAIVGNPIVLDNVRWVDACWRVAQCSSGFYYLTVKQPHHAMACYITDQNSVYYLEPEEGLYLFDSLGDFVLSMAAWYANRVGQPTNPQFKIYQVCQAGMNPAPTTRARPLIGSHRV